MKEQKASSFLLKIPNHLLVMIYQDPEFEAQQLALKVRRERIRSETLKGHVKAAVMAVQLLDKPWNIKNVEKVIRKERRHVPDEHRIQFDIMVQEGLKEDIHNYFL